MISRLSHLELSWYQKRLQVESLGVLCFSGIYSADTRQEMSQHASLSQRWETAHEPYLAWALDTLSAQTQKVPLLIQKLSDALWHSFAPIHI